MRILYYPYKLISKVVSKFIRRIVKLYKLVTIKKTKIRKNVYNVGFIVQLSTIWDKQIDIYEELTKRESIRTYLFAIPDYDFLTDGIKSSYEDNFFVENYREAIKVIDSDGRMVDLKKFNLDYLFYPRPYDYYLPKQYRSSSMYKCVKCCYIPYGLTGSDNFDDLDLPFFDNIYCSFMDSDHQRDLLKSHYPISVLMGTRKIFSFGYPVLTRFLGYSSTSQINTILWTPRWSMDPKLGGSNFLRYQEEFLELIKSTNYTFIFRPHPLMFDELIKKGFIDENFKERYLKTLADYNVVYDIVSPIEKLFEKTDLLITDYSSIIPQFFVTNRPIIYCEGGIPLNIDYREMVDYSYKANNWDDVKKIIESLSINGDNRSEEREKFINIKYRKCYISTKLIADEIEKGV